MAMRARDGLRLARFVRGVLDYARADLDPQTLRDDLARRLATREERFLGVLRDGVFERPGSPYLALLRHAGIEEADVRALVGRHGLEGALGALRDAGVTVSPDELRGRVPIVRAGGLELHVTDADFDSPFVPAGYRGATSGSTGAPRRTLFDPVDVLDEAAHHQLWVESVGARERPLVVWRSVPPSPAGIRNVFRSVRLGPRLEAWFTPTRPGGPTTSLADRAALRAALVAARVGGLRIPTPVHVPASEPARVAEWLAARVAEGRPPVLIATPGACVRVVSVALDRGLDIHGTLVRCGGEPFTPAKLAVIREAGAEAASHYALSEVSWVAMACAHPVEPDDAHVLTDKLALLPVPRPDGTAAIVLTTLSRHTSKLFLNADTGDTAVVAERECGCALGDAGLTLHVHTIRSPEKLTSEGVTFLADDVLDLVERVLPGRFGGAPTDYQLVEGDPGGRARITVVVSPRVGEVDARDVVEVVLGRFSAGPSFRKMMTATLAAAGSIEVARREPFVGETGKVPALHKPRPGAP